jgi:protein-disulfide isomerase
MSTPAATRRDRRAEERQRAREERRRQRDRGPASAWRSPLVLATIAALAVGALLVGALLLANRPTGNGAEIAPAEVAVAPAALLHGRSEGDPNAPVTLDLWADFQCPVCDRFATDMEPLLRTTSINDGTVRLVYHDLAFIGQESVDAASAARIADALGGKFWAYHDLLFANQGARENGGAFTRDRLADMAATLGLDRAAFLTAMDDPQYAAAVAAETNAGAAAGIAQTPTLVIDGKAYPGMPQWSQLQALIQGALSSPPTSGSPAASPAGG